MIRNAKNEHGMSLVELVVVTGVLMAMVGVVYATFRQNVHAFTLESARNITQGQLRVWVERIVRDTRKAGYDPLETGAFGVLEAEADTLRFTCDHDGDGILDSGAQENLGYRLSNGELQLWHGNTTWRPLVTGISSLEFTYRDVDDAVTTRKEEIRLVEIEITATLSTARIPGAPIYQVSRRSSVELRNGTYE